MNKAGINNIIIGSLIIILFVLSFLVLRPIIIAIVYGLILAYVFHPIFKKLNKSITNKSLCAGVLMALMLFLVIAPIIYLTPIVIEQIYQIFENIKDINYAELITSIFPVVEQGSTAYSILQNLNNVPGQVLNSITDRIFSIIFNFLGIGLKFFVFIFTFFFAIRDSEKLKEYVSDISPFSKSTERRFMREFRGVTNAIVLGQVFIAIMQGLLLGIVLFLLGIPNFIIWTVLTIIVSVIPFFGPWLVWVPISIFLIVNGDIFKAVILIILGTSLISSIDNFIRPYLLSRSSKLPLVIALIGTIGGLYFLGIIGLVLGPLILAYMMIIIDFYKEGRLNEIYRENKRDEKE